MRNLFFAAIATLTVAVGTLAFSGAASAESSKGSHAPSQPPTPYLYSEAGGNG